ncbi:MAG: phytanoyl-CoA dioxygenase family protein [Abitibacteriaceae bacterium]|nr:phytanoyl-CoA dioxygenase family protein [Abditibacteriaceae bacterium]
MSATSTMATGELMQGVAVQDIEVCADDLDVQRAAQIYKEFGCLVVRGLTKPYLEQIQRDIEATAQQSIALLDQARKVPEGWVTPDGTLFLPAPPGFKHDKQIMVLAVSYQTSAAFFQAAFDKRTVDIVEAIVGPNIELFMNGQCLYKEPVGGHPKHLHQDSAYFDHRFDGPVATLNYVVDTNLVNGALYVVPGSHRMGTLQHVDTFSHLGLNEQEWPWERALPIIGEAGDSIFFHYRTIHGSQENHSEQPRPVFINRYRRVDDYVVVGATTTENREEAEKRAAEARKGQQRGFMVRGFRPYEAE